MSVILVTSDRFADHVTPPGHPERVERAEAMQVVTSRWVKGGGAVLAPRAATDQDLGRVHDAAYIEAMKSTRGRSAMLDPDTFTSSDSEEVARLAAGAVLTAVDHVLEGGPGSRAVALVRPPGHHAERDRAMGFCLYNNIAIGAAWARTRNLSRIAIVDYDVHHGNGTQRAFYEDRSILFLSMHQYPFYPGTGAATETGRGAGTGFTVNLPIEVGAFDADYDLLFRDVVVPVLQEFQPQLVLVSAGFDAHERDPLAGMRVSTAGYARVTSRLLTAADQICAGRVVFATEGGYDTQALTECLQQLIGLTSGQMTPDLSDPPLGDTSRGEATCGAVRRAHRDYWACLR